MKKCVKMKMTSSYMGRCFQRTFGLLCSKKEKKDKSWKVYPFFIDKEKGYDKIILSGY